MHYFYLMAPLVFYTVLPIGLMLAIERYVLFRLGRTACGKDWVRSKFWLHPNFISRCRFPMGVVCVALYHSGTVLYPDDPGNFLHHAGVLFFAFWMISDMTDGTIARHFQLHTEEGENIDPLSDKLLMFPLLFYLAILDLLSLKLVIIFLVFDVIGTVSRYYIENKAANLFGKSKTLLATTTPILVIMQQMYFPGDVWIISEATLIGAVFLAFCSMSFKIIPNYWYANILSILNLICGIVGISLILFFSQHSELPAFFNAYPIIDKILSKNYLELAYALVFLGQFLDMFDGRAADKWGSTPKGELLDDLADGTNFGGTISFIIWGALQKTNVGILLGILHLTCTVFRLYRFIQNKRKAGVDGGVQIFEGLPSPAGALITGAVALLNISSNIKIGLIIGICFLMVSKIKYIHFGRVILPALPKFTKVALLTFIILAVFFGLMPGNTQILRWMFFLFSFAYLIFGYNWKFYQNTASNQQGDTE